MARAEPIVDQPTRDQGFLGLAALGHRDPRTLNELLDQLGVAACLYDVDDAVVLWNATYLEFFPEQADALQVGTSYAATLRRFFASNLAADDLPWLERHVAAAVRRHHVQTAPFVFQRKSGRWLKVASLALPGGGRVRLWRDVTAEHAGAGQRPTARALAAIDTAYAVFAPDGGLITANKRYQELFPEIGDLVRVGVPYTRHLERIAQASLAIEDAATLRRFLDRARAGESVVLVPMLLRRAGGGWLQLEERRSEDGGLVAIWTDATRQAEAQAEIDRLQAYLQDAIEAIPHGLVLFDAKERVAFVNRRLATVDAGLAAALAIGRPLDALAAWRAARSGGGDTALAAARLRAGHAPEELAQPDGRRLQIAPFRTGHGDLLVLLTDTSREHRAEAELQRQRDLAHQNEKLAALGSLLAGVAHELNNPLSVVVGRAAMLEEDVTDPRLAASLRSLRIAAERCAKTVRTFLAVARQKPRERRPFLVRGRLDAALDMLAYGLSSADITVEKDYRDEGATVLAEEDALDQVFSNLLVNARHALAEAARPRRLIVGTARRGAMVEIVVADTGPGVPEAIRARIFDPFFTTKPVGSGTGIGLAVCHGIVSAHGGTLVVEERPGGGARFVVRLPLVTGDVPPAGPEAAEPTPSSAGRILIVDDEPEIAELFRRILARRGYVVAVAAEGAAAMARLREQPFDVVVTDLRMPGLDGHELVAQIGRRPAAGRPALLVVTGDPSAAAAAAFAIEPPPVILEKPVEPAVLARTVADLLERRRTLPAQ